MCQLAEPFKRKVFTLHGNNYSVLGSHHAVQGQQSEGGRAIDQDVIVAADQRLQGIPQTSFAVRQFNQFDLCAGEAPNRAPPPGNNEPGKKRGKGRPTVRTIELAYASLKQDDRDDHEDGLESDDERKALRLTLQWILGGRARCPIRLRKKSKKKGGGRKSKPEAVDHDYTESVPARAVPTRSTIPR